MYKYNLIILSLNKNLLEYLSEFIGITYSPSLLFLVGILFSFLLIFYLMLVISDIQRKLTRVIQDNAILKNKLSEKEK